MAISQTHPGHRRAAQRSVWHTFLLFFGLTYLGALLDMVTTAVGYRMSGSGYEQNPLGALLILRVGWLGMGVLITVLAAICFVSFRVVAFHLSPRITIWIALVLGLTSIVRWMAVITAVLYITGHA